MATAGADGRCDVSPRGGAPGFVSALDEGRLAIPDASGNNRLDTVSNILQSGEIGLLFLIPGLSETLRVNGRACITSDPDLLAQHASFGKAPRAIIGVDVREAFLHCAKAVTRGALWDTDTQPDRLGLARPARVWNDHLALPAPLDERTTQLAS
jgi:PPOX class probable FMN-dependent enzyme